MNKLLTRFWFQFNGESYKDLPPGVIIGCGVTAFTKDDALNIIREKVFKGENLPLIKIYKEGIDISTLNEGHVQPNLGNVVARGIWFPLGYD